jgi:Glyoxalase/Bleomycin resistance protein/Dioxygenase superfamily
VARLEVIPSMPEQDSDAGEMQQHEQVGAGAGERSRRRLADELELSVEPDANPAAKVFQEAMFTQGIPLAAFEVSDIQGEYERLLRHAVAFTREPTRAGPVTIAIMSDTCGNLIQLSQPA